MELVRRGVYHLTYKRNIKCMDVGNFRVKLHFRTDIDKFSSSYQSREFKKTRC